MLPYGKQTIDQTDIDAIVAAVSDRMLTSGPQVEAFENKFATATHSEHAVAVNSGTAALHAALSTIGISENDEVIVPGITFVATANAVLYCGGRPVFADVDPDTLLIDVNDVANKITNETKAIITMDYAGQPCNYADLRNLANRHGLRLIADACHSLGGTYQDRSVGSLADMTCFSFHPVKQITTCEGGMVTTNNGEAARQMRQFRCHGIDATVAMRQANNTHQYDMQTLGFNYRLSDLQCALGISQLKKLDSFVNRRQQIAQRYQQNLADVDFVQLLTQHSDRRSGHHLLVMKWDQEASGCKRDRLYDHLKQNKIGANVHYRPVYQNSYYEDRFGMDLSCPHADKVYEQVLSLPIFPEMTDQQVDLVCNHIMQFSIQQGKRHSDMTLIDNPLERAA